MVITLNNNIQQEHLILRCVCVRVCVIHNASLSQGEKLQTRFILSFLCSESFHGRLCLQQISWPPGFLKTSSSSHRKQRPHVFFLKLFQRIQPLGPSCVGLWLSAVTWRRLSDLHLVLGLCVSVIGLSRFVQASRKSQELLKRLVAPSNLALSVLWMSPALSFKHVAPASSFEKKARVFRRRRRRRERSRMGSHANHANHANLDLRAAPGWSGHPRLYRELLDQAVGKCKTTTGRVEVDSVFTSLMLAAQTQSGGWTVKSFWGF